MPRVCTICTHPKREAIDQALIAGELSYRDIAGRFEISRSSLVRHKQNHLPATLAQAQEAREVANADDLLGQLDQLRAEAHRIKDKAEKAGDFRAALTGIRELVRIVELMAKVSGELQESQTVNVLIMPEWVTIRAAVVEALAPFPEARAAVAGVLQGVDHGQPR